MPDRRRETPRTDVILAAPPIEAATRRLGPGMVKGTVREVLDECRRGDVEPDRVVPEVLDRLPEACVTARRVLNATGVVVHTNLGRAPLSTAAREALGVASGSTDLEYDLVDGQRGRRGSGALCALAEAVPAAEAVHVVNNCAAALVLATAVAGAGCEIVVSRGELVEIGDGFRIAEILTSVGARLREVGATNRTTLQDYAEAITPATGLIVKVHRSNFEITGFTGEPTVAELAGLPAPLMVDIGSGLLRPHPRLPNEPDATTCLQAGADLVVASGDKLLGGPQCGLVLGRADLVESLRRHPLARALRVDKLTYTALEATLRGPTPPVLTALDSSAESLMNRAERIRSQLGDDDVTVVSTTATVGGGAAPGVLMDSAALSLPSRFAGVLRTQVSTPVVGRVDDGRLLLDLIAIAPGDDEELTATIRQALDPG